MGLPQAMQNEASVLIIILVASQHSIGKVTKDLIDMKISTFSLKKLESPETACPLLCFPAMSKRNEKFFEAVRYFVTLHSFVRKHSPLHEYKILKSLTKIFTKK